MPLAMRKPRGSFGRSRHPLGVPRAIRLTPTPRRGPFPTGPLRMALEPSSTSRMLGSRSSRTPNPCHPLRLPKLPLGERHDLSFPLACRRGVSRAAPGLVGRSPPAEETLGQSPITRCCGLTEVLPRPFSGPASPPQAETLDGEGPSGRALPGPKPWRRRGRSPSGCVIRAEPVRRCRRDVSLFDDPPDRSRAGFLDQAVASSRRNVTIPRASGASAAGPRSRCRPSTVSRSRPSKIRSTMVGALEEDQRTSEHPE